MGWKQHHSGVDIYGGYRVLTDKGGWMTSIMVLLLSIVASTIAGIFASRAYHNKVIAPRLNLILALILYASSFYLGILVYVLYKSSKYVC